MLTIEKISKSELRKNALNERSLMGKIGMIKNISSIIVKKILNSSDYKESKNIALFYPVKDEVDITGIISENKNFYFPKCINNELFFGKINSLDELKPGAFNILEPVDVEFDPSILDIIYIPALLANERKFRLGYGKGFYDRFFEKNNLKAKKITVLPSKFINNDFVEENGDIACDEILTEAKTKIC